MLDGPRVLARSLASRVAVLVALSLSGGASLVYQVAWTRRLISVTSATATAQAFVLAVFMAGLGLGAHAAGRWGASVRRPLLGYACVEAVAAILAIAWFPLLGVGVRARDALAGLGASPGTGLAALLGLASLYLLVPTTLLGASLPLALEHFGRSEPERSRGRSIAALYGLNTLGATLGCLLAGFVWIERFGLTRSAALGALVALGAAALAAGVAPRTAPLAAPPPSSRAAGAGSDRGLLLAAGLAGFAGLGAEVVWTRLFGLILFNTVYVLTEVLAAVLVGIALGSLLAGVLSRRDDPARRVRDAGLCAALAAVLLGVIPLVVIAHAGSMDFLAGVAGGHALGASITLLSCLVPASALLAAVLPLLAAASRDTAARSFGSAYAANIAGSVLGSLLTGFVLMPRLGLARTYAALELCALALALLLLLRGAGSRARRRLALLVPAGAAVACAQLYRSHRIPDDIYAPRIPGLARVLEVHEGVSSHVMVTEDPGRGERRLWINAAWVAGSAGPHRAFGHLPGLFVASPRRVLGIALGTGQTFAAALAHGAEHLDCVDIDAGVVALSRRWFADANHHLLDDPRVSVHVEDGRTFLRAARQPYDLIVLEPLQAWSAGTSNLYSREFYEEARRALAPGGVVAQWIPFYGQGPAETRAMVRTGLAVFREGILALTQRDGILVLSDTPITLPLGVFDARLAARGIGPASQFLQVSSAAELLPFMLLGPAGLRSWTEGAEVLTDDRPFLEFRAASSLDQEPERFREIMRSVLPHLDDLRPIITDAAPVPERRLAALLALRRAAAEIGARPEDESAASMQALEDLPEEARGSGPWLTLYRAVMVRAADSARRRGAGPEAAAAIYERALAHAPALGDAQIKLARAYHEMGRDGDARPLLDCALAVPATRAEATRLLGQLDRGSGRDPGSPRP